MKEITFEETPAIAENNTIGAAWSNLVRDPGQFVRGWNYKGAILSAAFRAPIFLVTYLVAREGWKLAVAAATVQFVFRFLFAGVTGAVIQSFRKVEPAWKAMVSILLIIPFVSHVFEYAIQASFVYVTATTDHTPMAIVRSICVSIFSALFALFIMRRNVMIVGEAESGTLLSDVKRIPRLVGEFIAFLPNEIAGMFRRGAWLGGILSILGWGGFSQMICWAFTGRVRWTYGGGKEIPYLMYWGVDGLIIMTLCVIASMIYFGVQRQRGARQAHIHRTQN
jgi:hypothetical protein